MRILLLTATVTPPPGATYLVRVDPAQRMADYVAALRVYLGELEAASLDAIVFAENSGSDLEPLRALVANSPLREQVEFLEVPHAAEPPALGRGYSEVRLMELAMRVSSTIVAAPADAMIWKVTGRYIIRNLSSLMAEGDGFDLCCHCRDWPMRWSDMYFTGWRKGSFPTVMAGAADRVRGGADLPPPEVGFRQHVDEAARRFRVRRRFSVPADLAGVSAFDNRHYEQGKGKAKARIRALLARIAPWVWV